MTWLLIDYVSSNRYYGLSLIFKVKINWFRTNVFRNSDHRTPTAEQRTSSVERLPATIIKSPAHLAGSTPTLHFPMSPCQLKWFLLIISLATIASDPICNVHRRNENNQSGTNCVSSNFPGQNGDKNVAYIPVAYPYYYPYYYSYYYPYYWPYYYWG